MPEPNVITIPSGNENNQVTEPVTEPSENTNTENNNTNEQNVEPAQNTEQSNTSQEIPTANEPVVEPEPESVILRSAPVESVSVKQEGITAKTLEEQAKAAFEMLNGNVPDIDTWEEVRDSLYEYARVKWHVTKPLPLELLSDMIIKAGGIDSASSVFLKTFDNSIPDSRESITEVSASATFSFNEATQDAVISGDTVITGTKSPVTAKSIELNGISVNSGSMQLTASNGNVVLDNVTNSGTVNKKTSGNAAFSINTNEYIKVSDCNFSANGYNSIEIGLTNTAPKKVVIENCTWNSTLSNNNVTVFAQADGAEITIKDCKINKTSNFLRISNRTNTSATFNIVNCEFNEWDQDPNYAGMILLQDYSSKSAEEADANNLFAPSKITINIINCYYKGKKIKPASVEACVATKNKDTQIIYAYVDKKNSVTNYNPEVYPTITIK